MDANGYDGLKFGEGITKDDITEPPVRVSSSAPPSILLRASMPPVMVSSPARA
jgi:hypothetical protein